MVYPIKFVKLNSTEKAQVIKYGLDVYKFIQLRGIKNIEQDYKNNLIQEFQNQKEELLKEFNIQQEKYNKEIQELKNGAELQLNAQKEELIQKYNKEIQEIKNGAELQLNAQKEELLKQYKNELEKNNELIAFKNGAELQLNAQKEELLQQYKNEQYKLIENYQKDSEIQLSMQKEELTKKYENALLKLQDEITHINNLRLVEKENCIQGILKNNFEKEFSIINSQQKLIDKLTEEINSINKLLNKTIIEKNEYLQLNTELQTRQEDYNSIVKELKELQISQSSSYSIGKSGEDEIQKLLEEISTIYYENVSKEPDWADFKITTHKNNIIICDSKKYKNNVPKKEIDKLFNNCEQNIEVKGGILISLNSKICKKIHGEIEFTLSGKPILFLIFKNIDYKTQKNLLELSCHFFDKIIHVKQQSNKNNIIILFQNALQRLNSIYKQIVTLKKNCQDMNIIIDKIASEISIILSKFEQDCNELGDTQSKDSNIKLDENTIISNNSKRKNTTISYFKSENTLITPKCEPKNTFKLSLASPCRMLGQKSDGSFE